MKFVIFHGAFGGPEENWFPELKERLESLGQEVFVPRFPVDRWEDITKAGPGKPASHQNLKNWLKVFEKIYEGFKKGEKLCFVGHSLGPLFILHVVEKYSIKLDSAIFVSPFMDKLGKAWQFDHVNKTFYFRRKKRPKGVYKADFDFRKLKKLIPVSYTLYSDNDPYVEKYHPIEFAKKLESSLIFVRRAGHMNVEVNLNEFPLVFELCKTRLDLSLYQKYLAHRRELYAVDYIKGRKEEEVIYLKPEEIFDEGVFKFRNLRKEGFCTFFTRLSSWNPKSIYYREARRAAKRLGNFIRVFVIDQISDLKKKLLIEQIELDLKAYIKVYLVMWDGIKDIGCEPDFGIWDKDDYLCVIKIGENKKMIQIKLSNRKCDIKKGNQWKKEILKRAIRIYNAGKDIENFSKIHASG